MSGGNFLPGGGHNLSHESPFASNYYYYSLSATTAVTVSIKPITHISGIPSPPHTDRPDCVSFVCPKSPAGRSSSCRRWWSCWRSRLPRSSSSADTFYRGGARHGAVGGGAPTPSTKLSVSGDVLRVCVALSHYISSQFVSQSRYICNASTNGIHPEKKDVRWDQLIWLSTPVSNHAWFKDEGFSLAR